MKRLHLISLLISITLQNAMADSALTTVEGYLGGLGKCQEASIQEFIALDNCIEDFSLGGSTAELARFGKSVMDKYAEDIFFQELVKRSHDSTKCQLSILKANFHSDKQELNDVALLIFRKIQPVLKSMIVSRNDKSKLRSDMSFSMDPKDISKAQASQKYKSMTLSGEIKVLDNAIESLVSQIPMGHHKNVSEVIKAIATEDFNSNQFTTQYQNSLNVLTNKMQKANEYYQTQSKKGIYQVPRSMKIAFFKSGQAEQLLAKIDPNRQLDQKLTCRLEAKYVSGPKNLEMAGMVALTAATVLTDGVAGIAVASLRGFAPYVAAAGVAQMSSVAINNCLAPTLNVSAGDQKTCSLDNLISSTLAGVSRLDCVTSVALAGLPILPVFRGGKVATPIKSVPIVSTPLDVKMISQRLAGSRAVRFFRDHDEVRMNATTLTPGKSYTVVVDKHKLVIGEDYTGLYNNSTAGSHVSLRKDLGRLENNYLGEAGSIKINQDGSIDISGYHLKKKSPEAAQLILQKLKNVLPEVPMRTTPDRLSTLPELTPSN